MAREINAELLDTKIEKAQRDLVKAKHRYDAAAATLKDLLDKRDALRQKKLLDAIAQSGRAMKKSCSTCTVNLKRRDQMLTEYYFAVRYGDIIILLYHEDMMSVWELLFKNSQKEKALKRFLEYCYMIDVKVAFEGLKGEKTKGLKATLKFAKEHDMCMTEAQIQGANNM